MLVLGGVASSRSRTAFAKFYPWALPVSTIAPAPDRDVIAAGGRMAGVLVAIAGCVTLSRREF